MIVRKPYAFLIKNFRLIHLFMLIISSYLLYKINNALQFFNEYVKTRQFIQSDTLISDTVPITIIIFSLLIIAMSVAIIVLFRKKDKPVLFYFSSVIFYAVLIIFTLVTRGIMTTIILEGIDPRISRIFRDFWLIFLLLQIIVTGFNLVRTLGFDVKKFHFGEDLVELKIEDEDNEEYELTTGFNADKFRMRSKMRMQELKSFYYENKFIIIIVLFLVLVVIPSSLIARSIVNNKRYSENEVISLDDSEFKITESFITKKSYNGKTLLTEQNSYLIVKFNINNPTEKEEKVNLNNLRIEIDNRIYSANTTSYQYFTDLGTGYENQSIINGNKDYIAVFVIKDEDLNYNPIIVRYNDELYVKNNQAVAKYYRIIINPKTIDKADNKANLKLGEEIMIDDLKFAINKYNIKDYYTYDIDNKTKYIVNPIGLILSLNFTYSNNKININEFLKNYAAIRYTLNSKTYNLKIDNLTPSNISDKLYLAVNEDIKDADEIYLIVKLRNTECLYKLK